MFVTPMAVTWRASYPVRAVTVLLPGAILLRKWMSLWMQRLLALLLLQVVETLQAVA